MSFVLPDGKPALMGVLNVTPDSFSDGGQFLDAQAAADRGLQMVAEGADLIDIGGESTRPGAEAVDVDEEIRRVILVVQKLASKGIVVSIDTSKPQVAAKALAEGAWMVNDVTGLRTVAMREVCAIAGCTVCIMHMQGDPRSMQSHPAYLDVVADVRQFLLDQSEAAQNAGVERNKIWIDPGIGFGKTVDHNLQLLNHLGSLVETGFPVLVGVSRKSFIGHITGQPSPEYRLSGTIAAQTWAQGQGARIIRSHDVKESREAIDLTAAIMGASRTSSPGV